MAINNEERIIDSKKKLVEYIQNGSNIKPVVIYDLIRKNVLSKDEFINLFKLNYKGEHRDHLLGVYDTFWNMMEKRITVKNDNKGNADE